MDPFETEKINSKTTGLTDDWRQRLAPTPAALSPQLPAAQMSVTPDYNWSPGSGTLVSTPMSTSPTPTLVSTPMSTLTPIPMRPLASGVC